MARLTASKRAVWHTLTNIEYAMAYWFQWMRSSSKLTWKKRRVYDISFLSTKFFIHDFIRYFIDLWKYRKVEFSSVLKVRYYNCHPYEEAIFRHVFEEEIYECEENRRAIWPPPKLGGEKWDFLWHKNSVAKNPLLSFGKRLWEREREKGRRKSLIVNFGACAELGAISF